MKSMANPKQKGKYLHRASKVIVRRAMKYFAAVVAEVLLTKFSWTPDGIHEFLFSFTDQCLSVNDGYIHVREYAQMLADDYGYIVQVRNKAEQKGATIVRALEQRMEDQCVRWLFDIIALVMLDKFGWDTTAVTRLIRNLDEYVLPFADGGSDHDGRVAYLLANGVDMRRHLR